MLRRRGAPSYRLHRPSDQAVVTLSGKDLYLGPHGSETSWAEYDRLVMEWLSNGRHAERGTARTDCSDVLGGARAHDQCPGV